MFIIGHAPGDARQAGGLEKSAPKDGVILNLFQDLFFIIHIPSLTIKEMLKQVQHDRTAGGNVRQVVLICFYSIVAKFVKKTTQLLNN